MDWVWLEVEDLVQSCLILSCKGFCGFEIKGNDDEEWCEMGCDGSHATIKMNIISINQFSRIGKGREFNKRGKHV